MIFDLIGNWCVSYYYHLQFIYCLADLLFYLISEFRVWETIRIWEKRQGEIISIKPLYIWLSWKNDNGEHTGEFFLVPNKLVRENAIIKVDLNKNAIKKVLLDLPFDSNTWDISYDEMLTVLEEFLQKLLATNTPTTVWFYKSYIWWKYKLDVLYKESWSIVLQLWFIDTLNNQRKTKQKIVAFMESLKKKEELVNIH